MHRCEERWERTPTGQLAAPPHLDEGAGQLAGRDIGLIDESFDPPEPLPDIP
ncbi:hypothetical protein PO002_45370 [Cupriavidus necator]|uniref:hypothetical protein n=1 Tax=Cupriavidus necator TaxID=106590 RepID=UPI0039C35B10